MKKKSSARSSQKSAKATKAVAAKSSSPRSRWLFGEPSSFLNGVLVGYTAVTFVLVLIYGLIKLMSEFPGY